MAGPVLKHEGPAVHYSAGDEKLLAKGIWHLLPLLVICSIIAFLDRVNIGYAQLQMKQTLPWSNEVYALGAGIFFVGYFLFEVPSNLMPEKIGARMTLLRIMFLWGITAAGMAFVETPTTFYILRFLLGVFEAGFFPGVILYLTFWYPGARRGKAIATFMTGAALAFLIAGPLCGAILKSMEGLRGLHGWQWLFITQGIPASMLGIVAFFYLKNEPEDADWLTPEEKAKLRDHLEHDAHAVAGASHGSLLALFRDPKIFMLSVAYALVKKTAAGGIALVSSLGNPGPAVLPWITTRINTVTGTPAASLYLVGAMRITAGVLLTLVLRPATAAKLQPAAA